MSSAGLAELMQKLNTTMTNHNKIGSTTTVNEQVDEMEVKQLLKVEHIVPVQATIREPAEVAIGVAVPAQETVGADQN